MVCMHVLASIVEPASLQYSTVQRSQAIVGVKYNHPLLMMQDRIELGQRSSFCVNSYDQLCNSIHGADIDGGWG